MVMRRGSALLMVAMAWAVAGCSVLLDPDNCSSDDECNGGICQDGVCLGGGEPSPDMRGDTEPAPDMAPDAVPDMAPDAAPDMAPDAAPDMAPDAMPPDPLRPECTLTAMPGGEQPTAEAQVVLTARVSDPDTAVADLTVTLDGEPLALEGEVAERTLDLSEGRNSFTLRAVDEAGLDCQASVAVVRDSTPPVIEALTPPDGAELLTGTAEFPVSGRVVDAHFTVGGPAALITRLDGADIAPEVEWDGLDFRFVVTLEEGRSELTLVASDDLGNSSSTATIAVRLDATPPVVIVDSPPAGAEVFTDRVEVRGRIQDDRQPVPGGNYVLQVTADGQAPVRIEGLADGQGAFARMVPLYEGSNTLTVIGRDSAGNPGQVVREITRLPAAPCVTITAPEDGGFTRVAQVEVAGDVCPAVDRVEVRVGDGAPVEAQPRDGRFRSPIALPGPGVHTITATAFAGDSDAADSVELIFDDTAPTVRITQPVDGSCTNARDLEVCGRANDPESGIDRLTLFVGDVETAADLPPEGGPFCQAVRVPEGVGVSIRAEVFNRASSRSEASIEVNVDRRAPDVCITRGGVCLAAGQRPWFGVDRAGRVTLAGRSEWGICGVDSLTVDGLPVNVADDGTFSTVRRYDDGAQDLQLVVIDTAGNQSQVPFVFRVDGTPPTIDDIGPGQDAFTTEAQVRLELEVSDAGSGLVSVAIGGQNVFAGPAGQNQGSDREVVARVVPLDEGLNTFEVVAVDLVGNRLVETVRIYRDTRPPVVAVLAPVDGVPAPVPTVVAGTIDDGPGGSGPASVTVNGVEAALDLDAGTWRAEDVPLDPAEPSITVVAVDALGNSLDPPLVQPVTVRAFGSNPPEVDGLTFDGAVGWLGVIDIDRDGLLDIVALGGAPEVTSHVFVQVQPGRFEARPAGQVGLPEGMDIRDAAIADLDADGTHDMVIVGVGRTVIALGNGQGGFQLVENAGIPGFADPSDLIVGDITRNGLLDLIVLDGAGTRLYLSSGDGSFDREPLATFGLASLSGYRAGWLVDVDNDRLLDVLAVGPDGAGLWLGDFFGPFAPVGVESGFVDAAAATGLVFDADRDGLLDLLTVGPGGGRFMLGDGGGGFAADGLGLINWPPDVRGFDRFDFDGDTRDDIVGWGGPLRLWRSSPDGFEQIDAVAEGAGAGPRVDTVAVADLDGDGDDDLIAGGPGGLRFVRNNRAATDPGYTVIGLDVRRSLGPPASPGPRDGWGARIDLDLVGGDDGLPERTLLARPVGATVVTLAPMTESVDVTVHYVDLGQVGQSIQGEPGLVPGQTVEVYARESVP